MDEVFPHPLRLPGQPEPPRERPEKRHLQTPAIVDEPVDAYGAEAAVAALSERLEHVRTRPVRVGEHGLDLLSPPFAPGDDRVDGAPWAPATLVVFGAHGTPSSRQLGRVLAVMRARHPATVKIAWRHFPDPAAHPRAVVLALAAEAAAAQGRFWALTRELLSLHHDDPLALEAAMVRAGLDPDRSVADMRAGTGADRIVAETASALASGVVYAPTLFIDGERYQGEPEPEAVSAAVESTAGAGRRPGHPTGE
jgi:2-hydroxychromene-2-carboxylate isomerase